MNLFCFQLSAAVHSNTDHTFNGLADLSLSGNNIGYLCSADDAYLLVSVQSVHSDLDPNMQNNIKSTAINVNCYGGRLAKLGR